MAEQLGGVITGLDTQALITKILAAQRKPIEDLQTRRKALDVKNSAFASVKTSLTALQTKIANLKNASYFTAKAATASDTSVLTATADSTAVSTTYSINIKTLASSTTLQSGAASGDKIANTINAGVALSNNASYGTALTTGTFTVNGYTITLTGGETLNSVLTDIQNNAPDILSASIVGDKITITPDAGKTVILGAGSDTSNFLSASRLYTSGIADPAAGSAITSLTKIGTIDTLQLVGSAASRSASAVTNGTFTINGVQLTIDNTTQTLNDVLGAITGSSADVYASYDSLEDRIVLTSKSTGSNGILVGAAGDTSNFLTSMKLGTGLSQTTAGANTTFTVNGGAVDRVSNDNILSATESGIAGLTISALKVGTVNVTVATDTSKIATEVQGFVDQFNSVQNMISSYSQTPTTGQSPVSSSSILLGDSAATYLPRSLRTNVTSAYGTGTLKQLQEMGITTTGSNNLLSFDSAKLSSALTSNFDDVQSVFNSAMTSLTTFISAQTDTTSGVITNRLTSIGAQQTRIDQSISVLEKRYDLAKSKLDKNFTILEDFQASSANILSFLKSKTS